MLLNSGFPSEVDRDFSSVEFHAFAILNKFMVMQIKLLIVEKRK